MICESPLSEGTVTIRRFRNGEGPALFAVFHSAIHRTAAHDYTPQQLAAWAPDTVDPLQWEMHMRHLNPFVAELNGAPVAYADVQAHGYIDHFYVSGFYPRRGIGTALMQHLHAEAQALEVTELTTQASITAQPFFAHHGFQITKHQTVVVRGIELANAWMGKSLASIGSDPRMGLKIFP